MTVKSIFLHSGDFARFQAYEGFPWFFERRTESCQLFVPPAEQTITTSDGLTYEEIKTEGEQR